MKSADKWISRYIYGITGVAVLSGVSLFMQNYNTHADNSAVDRVSISVPSSCTFGSVVDTEYSISMSAGETQSNIGQTTIKAYCNDGNGYAIFAKGTSGNSSVVGEALNNTDLISNANESWNIKTGTATSGPTSAWAMKLTAGTVTNSVDGISATPPTIDIDTNGSFADYHVVPSDYTMVAHRESETEMGLDVTQSGSYITTTYRVYANAAQPSGTYTGQVSYAMVHPYVGGTLKTLKQALTDANAATMQDENGDWYYTMQSMTSAICGATTVLGEASQIQLIDTRDRKLYWVTKLEDGHCWMTQNLDLDLSTSVALTSENTDLRGIDTTTGPYVNGYTNDNGIISWTPANATVTASNNICAGWSSSKTVPYSCDRGVMVADGEDAYEGHKYAGNYYSWTAAIASNDSSSVTDDTLDNVSNNPQNSICPKGWRLPTIANGTTFPGTEAGSVNEFRRLNVLYNNNATNTAAGLIGAPLYMARSGNVNGSGTIINLGNNALYWSSTVYTGSNAFYMRIDASGVSPEGYSNRYVGESVRCVASES